MSKNEINLTQFQARFSTEEACIERLFSKKWPNGYSCPRCGHDRYSFHSSRRLYQCGECKYQASVTAGTVFHGTRTPLKKWFWMIFLMTRQKSGVSMMSLQRMLGIKSYKTVWTMGHKIRKAMGEAESRHSLGSITESGEAPQSSSEPAKAERDSGNHWRTGAPLRVHSGRPVCKASRGVERLESQEALGVSEQGKRGSVDGAYGGVRDKTRKGNAKPMSNAFQDKVEEIRWAPVLVSNLKGNIRGVHHGVSSKHLSRYLCEFIYRHHHRLLESELFSEALAACARSSTVTYAELRV